MTDFKDILNQQIDNSSTSLQELHRIRLEIKEALAKIAQMEYEIQQQKFKDKSYQFEVK